jgi:hypothetical protein
MKFLFMAIILLSVVSCGGRQPPKQEAGNNQTREPRKLRYVMAPVHCGIIGFFNDGTVAGTVNRELSKHNIATLDTAEVFAHYTIDKHFIIFDDDHSSLDFSSDAQDAYRWVMVDYKWKMKVEE